MDVIYGLIPAMIVLGLVMVGILVWAVRSGQYDDFEGDASRILMDEDDTVSSQKKAQRREEKQRRLWPDAD